MGAVAWGLRPALRFPSPLIEPDVPISGIRLSDWLHRKVHGVTLMAGVPGTARRAGPRPKMPEPVPASITRTTPQHGALSSTSTLRQTTLVLRSETLAWR